MASLKRQSSHDQVEAAACDVVDIALRYANAGAGLARVAMGGVSECVTMQHYPANDVVDAVHGTRFYYHAHGSRRCPAQEHGHFHLFVHTNNGADFMHLAALSLNARGEPIRWFTTNAWVTGEQWHQAAEVVCALENFEVHTSGRLAALARWLTAMVQLFTPQLTVLINRRDAVMQKRCVSQTLLDLCEDRQFDVVSQCSAEISKRIQQFQQRGY